MKDYKIKNVVLNKIKVDENQPRKEFSNISELAESIKKEGLIQPIEVQQIENGHFLIIDGERRYRAYKLLKRKSIPCIIKKEESNILLRQLITDFQKQKLNLIEQANAINTLIESGMIKSEISEILAISTSKINMLVHIIDFKETTKKKILEKKLRTSQIEQLISLGKLQNEEEIVDEIIKTEDIPKDKDMEEEIIDTDTHLNSANVRRIAIQNENLTFIIQEFLKDIYAFTRKIDYYTYNSKLKNEYLKKNEYINFSNRINELKDKLDNFGNEIQNQNISIIKKNVVESQIKDAKNKIEEFVNEVKYED